jgi:hypothetical protein
MTIEELISFCQKKEWDNLFPILTSDLKDLSFKILVTGFIETHHPDRDKAHSHGLSCWENQLSGNAVPGMLSLFTSQVDLADFGHAFYRARDLLKDLAVASAIKNFVRKHKLILGQKLLREEEVPEAFKQQMREAFGDLRVSRFERETQARQQQVAYRRIMTEHLKTVDEVNERLAPVLGLKARLFSASFPAPQHAKAFKDSLGSHPEIYIDPSIKMEEFKALEAKLAAYDIKTNTYDMSLFHGEGARGIQIYSDAAITAQKLVAPPKVKELELSEGFEEEKSSLPTP